MLLAAALLLSGCGGTAKQPPPAGPHPEVQKQAQALNIPPERRIDLGSNVFLDLVLIPAGEAQLGLAPGEDGTPDDARPHTVKIEKPFYISRHEITQMQYSLVIDANPSIFMDKDYPVETISLAEAEAFCAAVAEKTKEALRLPTETEWEYACRAGTRTPFFSGDSENDLLQAAWFQKNSEGRPHAAGQKRANAWGVFDMHGNVWEFCKADPKSQATPARGGSWMDAATFCRSASRVMVPAGFKNSNLGFRVVVPLK